MCILHYFYYLPRCVVCYKLIHTDWAIEKETCNVCYYKHMARRRHIALKEQIRYELGIRGRSKNLQDMF